MGNQSTSGIVEEAIATSPEKALEVSSPDNLRQENETLIQEDDIKDLQEDGIKDFQEKTSSSAAADSDDAEPVTSPPIERIISGEKEEDKERIIEDCETQDAVLPKASNLEEQIPKFNNEVQDQSYTLKGEMQRNESNSNSNAITATNSNPSPQESVNITSEPQEDQNMLVKETEETQELVKPCKIGEKKEDNHLVVDDAKGPLLETCTNIEDLCMVSANDEEALMINELGHGDNIIHVDQEINQPLIYINPQPETITREEIKKIGDEDDELKTEDIETISVTTEAEILPPSMSNEQFSNIETPMLVQDSESKGDQVHEPKKSTSFDFGLPFVAILPEESERTPLLNQERPVVRSFSTSSTMRLVQNRSVQTEFLGNSLRYEAVDVEEKTIRMEGSKYESPVASYVNLENKEGTIAKQEGCDVVSSPKGDGKRKSNKSSLFTACLCCTAAIS